MLPDIRSCNITDLRIFFERHQKPSYRAQQIYDWIWRKGVRSFDEMTNVDKHTRAFLAQHFSFPVLREDIMESSRDGTLKFRFRTEDGHFAESVFIPTDKRRTLCVSSQVGCSLSCSFCATGTMGRKRNMQAWEIYDQVLLLHHFCKKNAMALPTNIVYMGMGEPLLNYAEVLQSIHYITSPDIMACSPRRITVSTAGISKMIKRLGDEAVRFHLALSLHAATDDLRSQLMDINRTNNIASLTDALHYFYQKTKSKITLEYVLLRDVNDRLSDAQHLLALYRRMPAALVNFIEYNPIERGVYAPSTEERTQAMMQYLSERGVNVRLRRSRGRDIAAACGQLVIPQRINS